MTRVKPRKVGDIVKIENVRYYDQMFKIPGDERTWYIVPAPVEKLGLWCLIRTNDGTHYEIRYGTEVTIVSLTNPDS